MHRFTQAWDGANAPALGALFATDADLVTPEGLLVTGRPNIVRYYATAFASGYAGSTGTGQILQQREIGQSFVLLDGRFTITGAPSDPVSTQRIVTGLVAAVLQHVGTFWQIVAWREKSGGSFTHFPARQ